MISVTEAIQLIQAQLPPSREVRLPLEKSLGMVSAAAIYSPIDVPGFEQSAMDGYAFDFESWANGLPLEIVGTIQAGALDVPVLAKGKAVRIFTGAPLPEGADTVVMQEKVEVIGNQVLIKDEQLAKGANVRKRASQTATGECVLAPNSPLNPGIIGLLAGLGIREVQVYAKPRIALIVTGKELVQPGNPLQFGQVYESNSYTLRAALSALQLEIEQLVRVGDELSETIAALSDLGDGYDFLILTGGISVGEFDYVQAALTAIGVEKILYKIRQKPGKPMFVGKKQGQMIFALPGNPAAVHTCFYRYVQPAIRQFMGYSDTFLPTHRLRLNQDFHKKNTLSHFLKARMLADGTVDILPNQESYKMNAYVETNGLVLIEEEQQECRKGEWVSFYGLGL